MTDENDKTNYEPSIDLAQEANKDLIASAKGNKLGPGASAFLGFCIPFVGMFLSPFIVLDENQLNIDNAELALRRGAKINYKNSTNGRTALIHAAYNGYPNLARFLVGKGADTNLKDNDRYTAFDMGKYYLKKYSDRYNKYNCGTNPKKDDVSTCEVCSDYMDRYSKIVEITTTK